MALVLGGVELPRFGFALRPLLLWLFLALLQSHRELLREFLQSCDMVKFARYQPTRSELEQVQERAVSFVTATKPEPTDQSRPREGLSS